MKKQSKVKSELSYFEDENPIGWLITKVAAKYEKEFFKKLTQEKQFSSIKTSDHRVLRFINASLLNSNDLARQIGVSKQAMSKSISSLERREFMVRKESKEDGRSQTLLLTEKGNKLIAKARQVAKELELATLSQLGAKDLNSLKDLLTKTLEGF
jgi:DNA-binding MarR family transcriptional regulator